MHTHKVSEQCSQREDANKYLERKKYETKVRNQIGFGQQLQKVKR